MFAAKLYFPSDYPLNPFKMVFDPPLLHPNSMLASNLPLLRSSSVHGGLKRGMIVGRQLPIPRR